MVAERVAAVGARAGVPSRVLVVDDEENIRLVLKTMLGKRGYQVRTAATAEAALEQLDRFAPEFVLSDVRLPGIDGIALCAEVLRRAPETTVIVMSAYGSVELALSAVRAGAYDYVSKPFKRDEVLFALGKAEERRSLRHENASLRREAAQGRTELLQHGLLGVSEPMRQVTRIIDKVSAYRTTVLIVGESGTGKELVAQAIHRASPRAEQAFVPVNCGAIPESLMESELFGHKRGAFTDAHCDKPGIFQEASGGTLFLDEVGEIAPALQVKLLRVLQEGCVKPLGAAREVPVDVRVVAATVRDLAKDVQVGRFREDLYYRLNVLQISVPPLRERLGDVSLLIDHFIEQNNARLGTHIEGMEERARKRLLGYGWPGNVRELENLMERAVVMAEGRVIQLGDLPERVLQAPSVTDDILKSGDLSVKRALKHIELQLIKRALAKTDGNRTAAAKLLELSPRALLYKIKDYGLGS